MTWPVKKEQPLEWVMVWQDTNYIHSTHRAEVPGGWLYRHMSNLGVSMVFVPIRAAP